MKRYLYSIIITSIILIFTSCLEDIRSDAFSDVELSQTITVIVKMPEGYNYSVEGLKVTLHDNSAGLYFDGTTDNKGVAEIKVAPGFYIASTKTSFVDQDGFITLFNGVSERIDVAANSNSVEINLNASRSSPIIFKELYYSGCMSEETGRAYYDDKYIILYNNSDQPAYLDSLCLGVVSPYNAPTSGRLSDWVKPGTSELRDSIPAASMVWMFPGTGRDNVLEPGEEVVLALNAIDHSASVKASVNLGKPGYWAIYDPIMTPRQATPEAGVKTMDGIWKIGAASMFVVSQSSPGFFIFRLGGKSIDQYVLDNFSYNPNSTNINMACLLVDKELILDAVECFKSDTDSKRFRPELDNGYIIATAGEGKSVVRKVDVEATENAGGRIVYVDTNDSSNDFEISAQPTIKGK